MSAEQPSEGMSIGQLGHHVGLHVSVNLDGTTVGGVLFDSEQWVPGVVVGLSALGDSVTVELDDPIGGTEGHGLFHRGSHGQERISVDDPSKIRAITLDEAQPGGVPDEIVDLVRAGKMVEAITRYRALNGATLDEARAALARL
jgi:hypothetical protein